MSELENLFQGGDTANSNVAAGANDEKKAKAAAMKQAMKESLQDSEFREKLHKMSGSLAIHKTLGYGDKGNIILKSAENAQGKREVSATSAIVGYQLTNIGQQPIPYTTEEFTKDANGVFVGNVVEKTIAPGQTVNISRKYLAVLTSKPEFSFTLSNGKIVSPKRNFNNISDQLSAHYFKFDDDTKVNDDSVKIRIDDNDVVKPEFQDVFGYLNNPKASRAKRVPGQKFTTQDLAANFVQKLMRENGMA